MKPWSSLGLSARCRASYHRKIKIGALWIWLLRKDRNWHQAQNPAAQALYQLSAPFYSQGFEHSCMKCASDHLFIKSTAILLFQTVQSGSQKNHVKLLQSNSLNWNIFKR